QAGNPHRFGRHRRGKGYIECYFLCLLPDKYRTKPLTARPFSPTERPSKIFFQLLMGQQYNKVEKRKRREAYIERKKAKAKGTSAAGKSKAKKPAKKKEA